MNTPLISVIMPVYNAEKYIDEAMSSILNQTFTDFEFIIIDDCSTDGSFEKLLDWSKRDSRIKLYRNELNSRIVKTLNRAIGLSSGKYIARMDADDISMIDRFEKQVDFLEKNPEYGLIGGNIITIDKNGNELTRQIMPNDRLIDKLILIGSPIAHPIWMLRRELFEKIGLYRNDTAEDYDFLLRLKTSNIKFTNLNEFILCYRITGANTNITQGLKQNKAAIYARKMYKLRVQFGEDGYSDIECLRQVKTNQLEEKLFNLSQNIYNLGVLSSSKYKKIFYFIVASILSPRTGLDIVSRYRWKQIIK